MHKENRRTLLKLAAAAAVTGGFGVAGTASKAVTGQALKPGDDSVMIVVDMQNDFLPGGSLSAAKGGDDIIPLINRLGTVFPNIVVTQDWHPAGHISFASSHAGTKPFQTIKLPYGEQMLWPDHCVQGSHGAELSSKLELPTTQLIIRKGYHKNIDSYSVFEEADHKTPTGLAGYVKQRGISKVFCTGVATDFCVAWTAMDARKAGFTTYVVEDASRGVDIDGSLAKAWDSMAKKGVHRIQSSTLLPA
ncbi:bifunctional nicotinamidase/pyrazinamidase [Paraburkholderia caribensis]|uniref:bifunctional nicotinamidase/pyrazinamidase n=1 Tax=Paraburkholderia caribensis TaxID=75105 RepID=UPI00078B580F|nr:bifunctional nicotinamidase/pyrazinamidase [Paraburkholderia caribensis]AMV47829.1 nicotinamidase [Paraburkholderia caribensis]